MASDQQSSFRDSLAGITILGGMTPDDRAAVARDCTWRRFAAGQMVFDKDSRNRDVMFLVAGELVVTGFSIIGKEVSFAELRAGDYFGEMAAIDGEARSATVTATKVSEIAQLAPERFLALVNNHPGISAQVMRRLSEIIRRTSERVMDFATLSAQQRVCKEILSMAVESPAVTGAWWIESLPAQHIMAKRVATSRETVARVLGDLAKGGLIVRKGRVVSIMDRGRLEVLINRLSDRD